MSGTSLRLPQVAWLGPSCGCSVGNHRRRAAAMCLYPHRGVRLTAQQGNVQPDTARHRWPSIPHSAFPLEESGFRRSCKPNFVCPVAGGENHLSVRPYPEPAALARDAERAAPRFPIWSCTGWGFPCRSAYARRGGLLPHLFTLTPVARGGIFSVALSVGKSHDLTSRVYPGRMTELRGIPPCGVRTFLPGANAGAILRSAETQRDARANHPCVQALSSTMFAGVLAPEQPDLSSKVKVNPPPRSSVAPPM